MLVSAPFESAAPLRAAPLTPPPAHRPAIIVVVVIAGVLGAAGPVAVAAVAWGPVAGTLMLALVPAAVAALADARSGRLPDRLVMATAAAPVLVALVTAITVGAQPIVALVGGACAAAAPVLALHLLSPAAMGFGDVKLAAALGATVGLIEPWAGLLVVASAAGLACTAAAGMRRPTLPFGPALVIATGAVAASLALLGSPFGSVVPVWR